MVKETRLRYTLQKRNTRTGKLEWWYRRGKVWKLLSGDPGTDQAASKLYWKLCTGGYSPPKTRTMKSLIAFYRLTPKFLGHKPRTRKSYEYRLRYIEEKNGNVFVARFRREHIIAARDANADRPGAANHLVAVLSALFEHAIDLGWRTDNPARGVESLLGGPGHRPWTEGEIARFRATATERMRTIFELCLGTGQRIGDVLRMTWDDIDDGGINVVQEKTGAELWIPFTPDLVAYLDTLPRGARTTIVANPDGSPVKYSALERWFNAARIAADCEGCVLHGLRKNATIELIETECTDEQIMAITGHKTTAMIRLYGKGARQRKLAKQARARRQ